MRRRTAYHVLFLVALGTAVVAFLALVTARRGFFDLNVYHGALMYWVHDDGLLYDFVRPRTEYGFTYPPFAALAMLPMAALPWHAVIAVSVALTVAATGLVLYWLVAPVARGQGWPVWFAVAVAACLAAAFEPMRETFMFGQVNAVLLALVLGDALLLVRGGSRFAGIGVGLATAIKLTPGIFILYLLVTRRLRATAVAAGTAAGATLLAAAVSPAESRVFWTEALWNTDRVGDLAYISNQSLQGMLARLDPVDPSRGVWLAGVVALLAVWAWRLRRADLVTGIALTGVVGGLISPVTWIHHLVWLIPALVLLVGHAVRAPRGSMRRRLLLAAALGVYAVLCSRLVWAWQDDATGVDGFVFSNAYLWVSLGLLVGLPGRAVPASVPAHRSQPGGPAQVAARRRA
jgi:alpha-1,2-mannosyltransferase